MFILPGSQNPHSSTHRSATWWQPVAPLLFLCLILLVLVMVDTVHGAQASSLLQAPPQWPDRRKQPPPPPTVVYGRRPPKKYHPSAPSKPSSKPKPKLKDPQLEPETEPEISETIQDIKFQPVSPLDGLRHLNLPSSLPHLDSLKHLHVQPVSPLDGLRNLNLPSSLPHLEHLKHLHVEPVLPLDPLKEAALKLLAQHHQPPPPYKKVKHHHYHPIVLYKKKRIPGKYWHEAQRRLVTKHGGLDVLGDITQLNNGKVLAGNFGQNLPNFNDGFFKPWELQERLLRMQRDLMKALLRQVVRLIRHPPQKGLFLVKEIDLLD